MSRSRILILAALLTAVLGLAILGGCKKAAVGGALPADLLSLLPADPAVVLSLSSLEDWEARREALADSSNGAPLLPGGVLAEIDLAATFAERLPAAAAAAAQDRPLALAIGVPAPLTNQMDMVLVFPVAEGAVTDDLADGDTFHSQLTCGDYVALATSMAYTPADSVPAIALDRLPGLMSVAVDLEAVVQMYRPLVQMGLAMAAMPQPEDAEGAGPAMSPEEAVALGEMMNDMMDSIRRQDLALDVDDRELDVDWRLDLIPGSPLDPGPQPDFARALALTGTLPADAPLKVAVAMDQTRQMETVSDYYLATMRRELKLLPEELAEGIQKWFMGYLEGYGHVNAPAAMSMGIGPAGMDFTVVMEPEDPAALHAHVLHQLETLGELGIGLTVTPVAERELAGVTVQGRHLEWDDAILAETVSDAAATGAAPTGGQLLQTISMLRRLTPDLWLAEADGLIIVTTTADDAGLTACLERVQDPGGPDSQLAELAAAAGPHTIEAFHGDVAQIMALVFEVMYGADTAVTEDLRSQPMPVTGTATLDGSRLGFAGTVDVAGLRSTVTAVKKILAEMEQKQGMQH